MQSLALPPPSAFCAKAGSFAPRFPNLPAALWLPSAFGRNRGHCHRLAPHPQQATRPANRRALTGGALHVQLPSSCTEAGGRGTHLAIFIDPVVRVAARRVVARLRPFLSIAAPAELFRELFMREFACTGCCGGSIFPGRCRLTHGSISLGPRRTIPGCMHVTTADESVCKVLVVICTDVWVRTLPLEELLRCGPLSDGQFVLVV